MSAIYFDARIDGAQLQKDIANINRQMSGMTSKIKKEGNEIDAISRKIRNGLAGAFTLYAGGNFIRDIARMRGQFQQLEVAFETMLQSKAKADKLMTEVVDFAQRTPFQLTDVESGIYIKPDRRFQETIRDEELKEHYSNMRFKVTIINK